MAIYSLGSVTLLQLQEMAEVQDQGILMASWDELERRQTLGDREQLLLSAICEHLISYKTHLANEATIWARAIYPLLLLAERDDIRAFSEVPLSAKLERDELRGQLDGALARIGFDGQPVVPYFLVVEAKRGVEGQEPTSQLLGGLLCAAWQAQARRAQAQHRIYGTYTVADIWTFVRCTVTGLGTDRPVLTTVSSREYTEKTEADRILRLIKGMLAEQIGG